MAAVLFYKENFSYNDVMEQTMPSPKVVSSKPKKNQDVLDFIEWVRTKIEDKNPKSFGLYMKLYKQVGKSALLQAVTATLKKQGLENKVPYFLGVIYRQQKETGMRKEKRAKLKIEGEQAQKTRSKYERLLKNLKKKLTPAYQRKSRSRSAMLHAVAKQERKKTNG